MQSRSGTRLRMTVLAAVLGAALLAGAGPARAQARHLGLFVGLNSADLGQDADQLAVPVIVEQDLLLGGDWTADRKRHGGVAVGAYYHLPVTAALGVQFEGRYARRGTAFDLADATSERTGETRYQLGYIEMPILARFDHGLSGSIGGMLLAGPVIGLKSAADLEISSAEREDATRDMNRAFRSLAVGAEVGIGVRMARGDAANVFVQARYYLGLTNVLEGEALTTRPRDFTVLAGVEFDIGG